jgi:ABC-2 type transport system permease protein
MIRTIAQKEFTSALRDKRIWLLSFVVFVLLLVAVTSSVSSHLMLSKERVSAQNHADEEFKSQPGRHPHRMAHYGSFAIRPNSPLSLLDKGLDGYTGTMIFLEAHQQNSANFSQIQQSSSLMRFGEMTVAFVLQWLIPLLIIFLTFNAFTQEKEEGTLKVLLSQGVTITQIAKGKILGYGKATLVIILPSLLMVAVIIVYNNNLQWTPDVLLRFLVFLFAYLCYFFIVLTGSIFVSAINTHSRSSLVTLLAIWIFSCIILPKGLANLGGNLYEAPNKATMDASVHKEALQAMNGHDPLDKKTAEFKRKILLKYKVDSVSQLPFNIDGLVMAEGESISSKAYQEHFEDLVSIYKSQNRLSIWAGFLDPYLAVRYLSMGMAGTDYEHFVDFQNAAEQYRFKLAQYLNNLQATKMQYKDKESRLSNTYWKEFPVFHYQLPEAKWAMSQHLISVAALLWWVIIAYFSILFLLNRFSKI